MKNGELRSGCMRNQKMGKEYFAEDFHILLEWFAGIGDK
jgi:hypothetical protein